MRECILLIPVVAVLGLGCGDKKAETPKEFAPMPTQGPSEANPKGGGPQGPVAPKAVDR
jgi:hypothetical protein